MPRAALLGLKCGLAHTLPSVEDSKSAGERPAAVIISEIGEEAWEERILWDVLFEIRSKSTGCKMSSIYLQGSHCGCVSLCMELRRRGKHRCHGGVVHGGHG